MGWVYRDLMYTTCMLSFMVLDICLGSRLKPTIATMVWLVFRVPGIGGGRSAA